MSIIRVLFISLVSSAFLVGCGGGGGSSDSGAEAPPAAVAPPPVAAEPVETTPPPAPPVTTPPPPAPETPTAPPPPTTDPEDEAQVDTDVILIWSAPLTRENGTAMLASEIQGYEIYYCKDDCEPEGSGITIEVPDTSTRYTVTLKEEGTWHFAVAVIDLDGLKSPLSNTVSVEITP